MENKIYRLYGINTAVELLRPEAARWESTGQCFTIWEDPRPCPSWSEILETMEKIKSFEDSINTMWTEEQQKNIEKIFGSF
jgi:hypothetical protein